MVTVDTSSFPHGRATIVGHDVDNLGEQATITQAETLLALPPAQGCPGCLKCHPPLLVNPASSCHLILGI